MNPFAEMPATAKMSGENKALPHCHPERRPNEERARPSRRTPRISPLPYCFREFQRGSVVLPYRRGNICGVLRLHASGSFYDEPNSPTRIRKMVVCVAPPALESFSSAYPALTCWANFCRASGPACVSSHNHALSSCHPERPRTSLRVSGNRRTPTIYPSQCCFRGFQRCSHPRMFSRFEPKGAQDFLSSDAQRRNPGPQDARCSRLGVGRRVARLAQGGPGSPTSPVLACWGGVSPGKVFKKEESPSRAAQKPEVLAA